MKWKKVDPKRFEGKTFELAPQSRIESAGQLADEFMFEIFDFDAGDYLITDESSLADYTEFGSSDTSPFWKLIKVKYDINPEDSRSEKLVDIFDAISARRHTQ